MEVLKEKIQNTIKEIDSVVELFYQQKEQDGYIELEKVVLNIMDTVNQIFSYQQQNPEFLVDEDGLTEALKETLSAMEEKDAILVADVLKYEVIEKFETIESSL